MPQQTENIPAAVTPLSAKEKKVRVLLLCSHPTQYGSPMWRRISQHPRMDVLVAYCSMEGAQAHVDPGFGVEVAWDVPLLDDYPWIQIKNWSRHPSSSKFFGLVNLGIWKLIQSRRFDAVVIFTGYNCLTFWIAVAVAKLSGVPILFGTDATSLMPRDRKRWKIAVKKRVLPTVFRLATIVIVPSEAGRQYIHSLGIAESRITVTPFVVANDWWRRRAAEVDRDAVRRRWMIPNDAYVVLFCAKLQAWKRPEDVLRAFMQAKVPNSYLVFAGDGILREQLEREANSAGISDRVRFLGFVNQMSLPSLYRSADIFALPSEYDPCPVVVCESMVCGCPVILSDQIRGRFDLVKNGETGFIYPCGDIDALASVLSQALHDRERLARMSEAARQRMIEWSPEANMAATIDAIEKAIQFKKRQ